jgi:hypothetical protein
MEATSRACQMTLKPRYRLPLFKSNNKMVWANNRSKESHPKRDYPHKEEKR